MSVKSRDPHSGYMTTGHEWNGITELNTPVPRIVYLFLAVTIAFSAVYWILMPAWPTGRNYTRGLLGVDQRTTVAASLEQAALAREIWTKRIEAASYQDMLADPRLRAIVRQHGRRLFDDNCAACHGIGARGASGFPDLTTRSWLWGGEPDAIAETIRVGINAAHPDTRVALMPAFGRDQMLPRGDIDNVVAYLRSLAGPAARDTPAAAIAAGKAVYVAGCAGCHGDDGAGKRDVGAPDLTDAHWVYGSDLQSVFASVWGGRQGYMPTWEGRLSGLDRKILTAYVLGLRTPGP